MVNESIRVNEETKLPGGYISIETLTDQVGLTHLRCGYID